MSRNVPKHFAVQLAHYLKLARDCQDRSHRAVYERQIQFYDNLIATATASRLCCGELEGEMHSNIDQPARRSSGSGRIYRTINTIARHGPRH